MSVIDKFLNAMKMNDDDDEIMEDDYLDDEYDDDEDFDDLDFDEDKPKRHFLTRSKEDDSYQQASETSSGPSAAVTTPSSKTIRSRQQRNSSKVSPMRNTRKSGMEVCVIRPKSMEDAREVTETLLDECTVILNMEGIDFELAQRIIDFACGSCYAISGKLQKISNYIFIITPASVDISGDFQEMVNGAYDVPAFGSDY